MPLFFLLAGIFHPSKQNYSHIIKRAKYLLLPYFLWAIMLYLFWFFIGRFYGDSKLYDLSPINNFIGVFYAQGGKEYMNWGIQMWFIPSIFLTFCFFYIIRFLKLLYLQLILLFSFILIGFLLPYLSEKSFVWSLDVSLVALIFYSLGFYSKNTLINLNKVKSWFALIIFGVLHISCYSFNGKVDMYNSIYRNEFIFILNGISGTLFYLFLFKNIPIFSFFSFLGKSTIPILALHLRVLTLIKAVLLVIFGITLFNFSELQKLVISIFQILMLVPIIFIINKYVPILNGKITSKTNNC